MANLLISGARAQGLQTLEIVPLLPHSNSVNSVAFSPDGTRVLSGSKDSSLKLWDAATGHLLRTLTGHSASVESVAFSADGRRVLSGGGDNTLKLWDAATGHLLRDFKGHEQTVNSVAFSPDGTRVLSGSEDNTLKLWDESTGEVVRTLVGHARAVNSVAFSPDGARVLSGSTDKTLRLWDVATGQLLRAFTGHAEGVRRAVFSRDGIRVLSSSYDRTMKLWDAATGQLLRTFEHSDTPLAAAFSPDGSCIVSGSSGQPKKSDVKLWDAATGRLLRTFTGHEDEVNAVIFSPDGSRVLSGGGWMQAELKLWDATTGQHLRAFEGVSSPIRSVAVSPDGASVLSGGGTSPISPDKVKLWDTATGELRRTFEGHSGWIHSLAFSPDGAQLLSGSGDLTMKLWHAATGQPLRTFVAHAPSDAGWLVPVAFSPDGTHVVAGSDVMKLWDVASRGRLRMLWDVVTGWPLRTFAGHPGYRVTSVAFSPDGTRVLSGSGDETLKLWDAATSGLLRNFKGHNRTVNSVAFSPSGTRLLSGSDDNTLKLWDASTGGVVRTFEGHARAVNSVAFSPDGTRVLSGSDDRTLKLWDAATGELLRSFLGHSGYVTSVAFLSEGRRVLSGGADATIRLWDVATGDLLATLIATRDADGWLVMTPEGFFASSSKGHQLLSIVRGLEVFSIDQFYQHLYRPDLVREKLAGDPNGKVREAAAKLDLAKLIDSGLAPKVGITSHKLIDASLSDRITVEATVADQGGGIGRAEWRINGITVGVVDKPAADARLAQTVALDPGENTIELVAYNGQNLVSSVPAHAKITWTGSEPSVPPRLHVLAVGINDYLDGDLKLRFAVPDAKALTAALKEAGQGHYEDVLVAHVLDGDATAENLDKVFLDLAGKIRPRDVFMFFAAGHGKTVDGRYYFFPRDLRYHTEQSLVSDGIGQDKLQAWLARIPAKKAVLMFDTCQAGSLTEREHPLTRGLEHKAALGRLIQATGRATLTASSATQDAFEGYGGHGVFTFALLDALARGDSNNNGLIELAELIQHIDGLVPAIAEKLEKGARQYPQMDAHGSNFSLARQVPSLAPGRGAAVIIPVKPTHVNSELVQIFSDADSSSAVVQQLPPFTTVTLVKTEASWVLVAKDGKLLGYVSAAKLHKLN